MPNEELPQRVCFHAQCDSVQETVVSELVEAPVAREPPFPGNVRRITTPRATRSYLQPSRRDELLSLHPHHSVHSRYRYCEVCGGMRARVCPVHVFGTHCASLALRFHMTCPNQNNCKRARVPDISSTKVMRESHSYRRLTPQQLFECGSKTNDDIFWRHPPLQSCQHGRDSQHRT